MRRLKIDMRLVDRWTVGAGEPRLPLGWDNFLGAEGGGLVAQHAHVNNTCDQAVELVTTFTMMQSFVCLLSAESVCFFFLLFVFLRARGRHACDTALATRRALAAGPEKGDAQKATSRSLRGGSKAA